MATSSSAAGARPRASAQAPPAWPGVEPTSTTAARRSCRFKIANRPQAGVAQATPGVARTVPSVLVAAVIAAAFIVGLPLVALTWRPPGWGVLAPVWFTIGTVIALALLARLLAEGWRGRR